MKAPLCTPALLTLALAWATLPALLHAEPVITEFMASNAHTLADEDGQASDWIELHNPDASPVSLAGWYLTDSAKKKNKWPLPALTLPPGGYVVLYASGKDRRDPAGRLHTNFSLDADGEYLALIRPDGATPASEFAPAFPAQSPDFSYGAGRTSPGAADGNGYLRTPTPGAPNSAIMSATTVTFSREGGPFSRAFALELQGAGVGEVIRYEVAAPGAASPPEPTLASAEYQSPLAIDTSVVVRAAIFSANGAVSGHSKAVSFVKTNQSLAAFSSQLPVLVLDYPGAGPQEKDGVDHPGWLHTFAGRPSGLPVFASAADTSTPLTSSVRGSSSASFPKKGYNLKLRDELGHARPRPLLDLPGYEKWALVAPWSYDLTYFSNAFAYALSNRIGRWAPRTRFVEVFNNANGGELDAADYAGIFLVTDRIEPGAGRVALASPTDVPADAGYLLKIDTREPGDIAWVTERGFADNGYSSIILVAPKPEQEISAELDYIRGYVQRMENALHADRASNWSQRTYLDYSDRGSWVDHHILNTFVCNPDAFVKSAYFTKNRGGKLTAGPVWDFDRAMGSIRDGRSWRSDVWFGHGATDVWQYGWWGVLARDPEFMQDWIDRWQSLRRTEFSDVSLCALSDSLGAAVGDAAARRDAARWPENAIAGGNYADEISFRQRWLTERATWIDTQFVATPRITSQGTTLTFTAPLGAVLVYTLDGSDPRSLGGEVAPNATFTPVPLVVQASANVHVRSYRADLRRVYPGSPWSSAVGGGASSPLAPKARLVNLSSRGMVGAGENALIVGVVVGDSTAKRYLARAVGPGLAAFGAAGTVPDPQLTIVAGTGTEIGRNNGWASGDPVLLQSSKSVGAFALAPNSADAALSTTLGGGASTLQITSPTGRAGVGLAELYELDGNGRTSNLSARAFVSADDNSLVGGFVVSGPAYKRVLIRAVGPTLASFGVANALADPVLTLRAGAERLAANDCWSSGAAGAAVEKASRTVGAFPLSANSEDAALLVTLPPGDYTITVSGKNGATGVALLEIYDVP